MLGHYGVTGVKEEENACVLAQWIRRESGLDVGVGVPYRDEEGFQKYGVGILHKNEYIRHYSIDEDVMEFIRKFDEGQFSNLVTPYEEYD